MHLALVAALTLVSQAQDSPSDLRDFVKQYPAGGKVEILAVSDGSKRGPWLPDGSPIRWDRLGKNQLMAVRRIEKEMAVRLASRPNDVFVYFSIDDKINWYGILYRHGTRARPYSSQLGLVNEVQFAVIPKPKGRVAAIEIGVNEYSPYPVGRETLIGKWTRWNSEFRPSRGTTGTIQVRPLKKRDDRFEPGKAKYVITCDSPRPADMVTLLSIIGEYGTRVEGEGYPPKLRIEYVWEGELSRVKGLELSKPIYSWATFSGIHTEPNPKG